MSYLAWIVIILWPVIVVFAYSFVVDATLSERAKTWCDSFNNTGRALKIIHEDLEKIKDKIGLDEIS